MKVREELDGLAQTQYPDRKTGIEVRGHIVERFRAAKGAIAMAYNCHSDICAASKDGIEAICSGDAVSRDEAKLKMEESLLELRNLDLPYDIFWQHNSEAGQEVAEYYAFAWRYPKIFGGSDDSPMPTAERLVISDQSWLSGIGDSVSELGKVLNRKLCDPKLSLRQRIVLRERFIADSEEVYAFLHQFMGKGVVPMIINNSRRRGFRNTFRGLLQSVEWVIARQREALVAIYDRMPATEEDPTLVPNYTPTSESEPPYDPPHFDP